MEPEQQDREPGGILRSALLQTAPEPARRNRKYGIKLNVKNANRPRKRSDEMKTRKSNEQVVAETKSMLGRLTTDERTLLSCNPFPEELRAL